MNHHSDTGAVMAAKLAPSATVSVATLAGVPVSELVLWCTLIYTVLMVGHKGLRIWLDWRDRNQCSSAGKALE
jgi:Phage holin T7 family, holin superfamily II